jgi:hypothetical protein
MTEKISITKLGFSQATHELSCQGLPTPPLLLTTCLGQEAAKKAGKVFTP